MQRCTNYCHGQLGFLPSWILSGPSEEGLECLSEPTAPEYHRKKHLWALSPGWGWTQEVYNPHPTRMLLSAIYWRAEGVVFSQCPTLRAWRKSGQAAKHYTSPRWASTTKNDLKLGELFLKRDYEAEQEAADPKAYDTLQGFPFSLPVFPWTCSPCQTTQLILTQLS